MDSTVRLWNTDTGETVRTLNGHTNSVWSVSFSPDGKFICSGSRDASVRLWNTHTGENMYTQRNHKNPVLMVAFSLDRKIIFPADNHRTLIKWKITEAIIINTIVCNKNVI